MIAGAGSKELVEQNTAPENGKAADDLGKAQSMATNAAGTMGTKPFGQTRQLKRMKQAIKCN